jgi:hypothetical protein
MELAILEPVLLKQKSAEKLQGSEKIENSAAADFEIFPCVVFVSAFAASVAENPQWKVRYQEARGSYFGGYCVPTITVSTVVPSGLGVNAIKTTRLPLV